MTALTARAEKQAPRRELVIVTGLPRSGTTPMGDALAQGRGLGQLYEPLNATAGDKRIQRYFAVPGADISVPEFAAFVDDVKRLKLDLRPGLWKADGPARRMVKRVTGGRSRHTLRMARVRRPRTLIWKDPFALFTLDRLVDLGNDRIVVTFRNPAAIASSFERLRWKFDIADLERRLERAGIHPGWRADPPDTGSPYVDSAVRLYLLGYGRALALRDRYESIEFVDNADLAKNHDALVAALRAKLGLPPAPEAHRPVERPSAPSQGTSPSGGKAYGKRAHVAHRDLSRVNTYYDEILTPEQIQAIEKSTRDMHRSLTEVAFRP